MAIHSMAKWNNGARWSHPLPLFVLFFMAAAACESGERKDNPAAIKPDAPPMQFFTASGSLKTVPGTGLKAELAAGGFVFPLGLEAIPGGRDLAVLEQKGKIWLLRDGRRAETPLLDLSGMVTQFEGFSEQGLLGLAFHPGYPSNRRLFAHYTDQAGGTVLAEFSAAAGSSAVDPATRRILFQVKQPYPNHNGGKLAFGPDGFLYLALGDGGSGGDPEGNGQKLSTPLGKILRFDVSKPGQALPAPGNPLAGREGARPEIWHWGLRNPWRFSFDRKTGEMFIGDVGQGTWEEVDVVPTGAGGRNFGWVIREGFHCFSAAECSSEGLTPPVLTYRNTGFRGNCSITGGHVYRGKRSPRLEGHYFFGDYCSGAVWSVRIENGRVTAAFDWSQALAAMRPASISAFGEDADGEIIAIDHRSGKLWRLAPTQ
ncbi:MAG: Aldose sugar dehydrogenase YliI [Myxococcota bacterium]|nr:Aldose sugar dehydrogenase YliI [Myxococcota bacterium]